MSNDRSNAGAEIGLAGNAWTRFWFTPIPTTGLHCLRVLSGLLFCAWLLSFLGNQVGFFSLTGWLDAEAYRELQNQPTPIPAPIGWSMLYLAGNSVALFQTMYWGSLLILLLFTLGVATRITGVLTWVVVVSFLANPAITYEGDYMLAILAFYLMIGHLMLGQWNGNLSIAERILGARGDIVGTRWLFPQAATEQPLSHGANLMMRLLQIHFVIIILTSVLHKFQLSDWWAGVALWYPLNPTLQATRESLIRAQSSRETVLFFLGLTGYLVLAWQLAFPLFAWRTGWWRGILLGGAMLGWIGAFFIFKLPLFGPFTVLCCLSFLRPEEWTWITDRLRSVWTSIAVGKSEPASKKVPVAAGTETNIKK
ncbi:MAG: hypothetical protein HY289_11280 [Planctomycetes bacterium]|nr:hypothetical protein [Planctomycetota bacterium]